ncbi:MAG TPA: FkbM family methyltransferase [Candidatus Udaeobacter sp.]|jgi:FkbM family methyltransferase|nr:FkbM family methyltransferase [Candidatus Udaeobacter sp.]
MALASIVRRFGNKLYEHAFPLYRPLYAAYKAYSDCGERELLKQVLNPGCIVVDAGANIGIYSEFLSRRVGPTGIVHSFEPSPDNFNRLRAATRNLSNVRLNQLAVSDKTGESLLYLSNNLNVDHRVYPNEGETRRTLSIRSIRLDDYFKPGERVDLVKMDLQGFELHALQGINRVVADNPDIKLLLEFCPYALNQAGASGNDLLTALREKGMMIQKVSSKGLIPLLPDWMSERPGWYVNLFAS